MKRCVSIFFLLLYLYNFAGYLVIFSVLRHRVKADVKQQLMENVPDSLTMTLAFHTQSLELHLYPIQWTEEYEFHYAGEMYDIISSYVVGDTTYFVCLNDLRENLLFANLDIHVNRHMGNLGNRASLDSFQDVFKNSFPHSHPASTPLVETGMAVSVYSSPYRFLDSDVPFHPPRFLPEIRCL